MSRPKIRVLVVDDSALMRKKIAEIINNSHDCEVVAMARDGYEALQIIRALKPDVITLDLQLPQMDGLTCLMYIMSEWPTPVIILSAFTTEGSETAIKALEYGAIDFIAKPDGVISPNIEQVGTKLLNKIRVAAKVPVSHLKILSTQKAKNLQPQRPTGQYALVVLGASTGGPRAIMQVLKALPADFPAAVWVVQHMPKYFITTFARRLDEQCQLEVKQAENDDPIVPGTVLVAPAGSVMGVRQQAHAPLIHLTNDKQRTISPSIDLCFSSAAKTFESRVLGVILTGMGKDGTKGCLEIKQHGGKTIAEDESTSIVFGMPASAIAANAIDSVLPLDKIAKAILTEVSKCDGQ